jgi:phosphoribosylglycinamide formyltransferase-1
VAPDDDASRLSQRVLEEIELKIYPQAVAWMARGDLGLQEGAVWWRGARLLRPLTLDTLEDGFR